ncbi:alpha/beta fold hydrolase [Nonomuraea rubra]|uniref:alpha/beta fold hydrolase n=1 Tax=Nonomuraea rubra TaxID=46180 RepID=UPI0031EF5A76
MKSTGVAVAGGIRLHYTRAGSGPLVVLLHGWPQTGLCWEPVLGPLAERHTVVAPDLRGYGLSDKPATGYDKRRMAADLAELVGSLGFERASVVGHDRGARVAHRWALDRPDQVERLAVLDVVPTREMFRRLDASVASAYWHWLFHLQPDLPERLVGQDVRGYLEYFFERWTYNRHGLSPEAVDAYVRAFSRPGALRAGFDDYRAHERDLALDDEDAAAGAPADDAGAGPVGVGGAARAAAHAGDLARVRRRRAGLRDPRMRPLHPRGASGRPAGPPARLPAGPHHLTPRATSRPFTSPRSPAVSPPSREDLPLPQRAGAAPPPPDRACTGVAARWWTTPTTAAPRPPVP